MHAVWINISQSEILYSPQCEAIPDCVGWQYSGSGHAIIGNGKMVHTCNCLNNGTDISDNFCPQCKICSGRKVLSLLGKYQEIWMFGGYREWKGQVWRHWDLRFWGAVDQFFYLPYWCPSSFIKSSSRVNWATLLPICFSVLIVVVKWFGFWMF